MTYDEIRKKRLRESLNLDEQVDSPPVYKVTKEPEKTKDIVFYVILATIFILFHSLFAVAKVDGKSMDPTLKNNQFIMVSKTDKVDRFDIVILNEREVEAGPVKKVVKRVIGMPGDTVTVLNGELFINDKKYEEDYLDEKNIKKWKQTSFTIKIPKNHYFVMGDNRDISKDSRMVGNFVDSAVVGVKMFE